MDPALVAGIEHDLRHYRRWRARVAELDAELEDVSDGRRDIVRLDGVQHGPGDPTFHIARQRERLWQERARLLRRVQRVENFLEALTGEQRRLVELWYFEDMGRDQVALEMRLSRSAVYRLKGEALRIYAEVAGLLSPASSSA